ncbi:hypothetical protein scyTo_0015941 [Scyliorhinus torazame]|uniref:Band 3 cytoplasmic domain-containing protein n=1 Tax=Scyliorhinus torazame TaxID=75743 RepID=A0A401Q1B0_SCYTO|nr:hypothetical protein [Scyliorhinus torazame]
MVSNCKEPSCSYLVYSCEIWKEKYCKQIKEFDMKCQSANLKIDWQNKTKPPTLASPSQKEHARLRLAGEGAYESGHRTLYIGVHVPQGRRSHRRHRHRGHKHRKRDRERDSSTEDGRESPTYDTPSQRVQFILGTEDDDEEHIPHDLFTELDEICMHHGEDTEWKETARWLKFEEDVEDGGDRWSKPYVATLSLHSLFELRSCIINGTVLLDMRASTIEEISGIVANAQNIVGKLLFVAS